MEYIARIKELKSKQQITSDKLAELTGIPKGTLTKILSGVSDSVKLSNIVAIADVLGVSLDYLVLGKGSHELFVGYQTTLDFGKKGRNRHQSVRIL